MRRYQSNDAKHKSSEIRLSYSAPFHRKGAFPSHINDVVYYRIATLVQILSNDESDD